MATAAYLFADHVHMGLEHQRGFLLSASGTWLVYDDVVQCVPHTVQPLLFGKGGEITADSLLVAGAAGDGGDLFKESVDGNGYVCNGHIRPP